MAIEHASRIAWGFRNEVWQVGLAGGRQLAVIRFADAASAPAIVSRTMRLQSRLHAASIPNATVIDGGPASTGVLITEFVEGAVGAALLDESGGPALVGSILGATWRRLTQVDPNGLDLDRTWHRPEGLVEDPARPPWPGRSADRRTSAAATRRGGIGQRGSPRRATSNVRAWRPGACERRSCATAGSLRWSTSSLRASPTPCWMPAGSIRSWPSTIRTSIPRRGKRFLRPPGSTPGMLVTRDLLRILPMLRTLEILDDRTTAPEHRSHWVALLQRQLARA